MKVSKSVETTDGTVMFEGELNADELELIIGIGLNYLLQQGAFPFKVVAPGEQANMVEGSDLEQ